MKDFWCKLIINFIAFQSSSKNWKKKLDPTSYSFNKLHTTVVILHRNIKLQIFKTNTCFNTNKITSNLS